MCVSEVPKIVDCLLTNMSASCPNSTMKQFAAKACYEPTTELSKPCCLRSQNETFRICTKIHDAAQPRFRPFVGHTAIIEGSIHAVRDFPDLQSRLGNRTFRFLPAIRSALVEWPVDRLRKPSPNWSMYLSGQPIGHNQGSVRTMLPRLSCPLSRNGCQLTCDFQNTPEENPPTWTFLLYSACATLPAHRATRFSCAAIR